MDESSVQQAAQKLREFADRDQLIEFIKWVNASSLDTVAAAIRGIHVDRERQSIGRNVVLTHRCVPKGAENPRGWPEEVPWPNKDLSDKLAHLQHEIGRLMPRGWQPISEAATPRRL